jgi:hypothetical protein
MSLRTSRCCHLKHSHYHLNPQILNAETCQSQSQSHIATDGQSVSKSCYRAHLGLVTRYLLFFWQLRSCFLWCALSDERTGLSFVYAAGSCHRSLSRVRVPWYSRPYITVSYLRLHFSPTPTTRRVTVEVFDPASTRAWLLSLTYSKSKSKSHCDWRSVSQ